MGQVRNAPSTRLKHAELINLCFCKTLFNPVLWSIVLFSSSAVIYGFQLKVYIHNGYQLPETERDIWIYISDLFLNLITLVFICRYIKPKSSSFNPPSSPQITGARMFLEMVFLILQLTCCYMFMFKLTYKSTLLKWLVHAQIYCALFSVYNNLRDESKGIDIFIKANDAILPVLLANSFKFVNTNVYDITNPNKTMALIALIYCISMPLMKFYCIFEYILHEIEILCESKSVTWMPNKIWIISTCLLQLIIFNLCNIAIRI